jgi:PspAB-like protein
MGFFDALLGRSKPKQPKVDALFALPSAAITLQAATGMRPSGLGAVCFKPAAGQDFAQLSDELQQLLELNAREAGSTLRTEADRYGYRWVVLGDPDISDLVTTVHMVTTSLNERGYGPQLLCSVFGFEGQDQSRLYLIYLAKRGTFYPFAPRGGEQRDNELELRARGALGGELLIEQDLTRWYALWGIPQEASPPS